MSYPRVLLAQIGARRHYLEPILFYRWGILESFYTDFYSGNVRLLDIILNTHNTHFNSYLYKHIPKQLKKYLDRYEPELRKAKIVHFPIFAYQYVQKLKQVLPQEVSTIFAWAGKQFCKEIIRYGLGNANTVYGFNSASLELFEYAKAEGARCVLDQTLAERTLVHHLLQEEEQYWSGWSLSPFKVNNAELELAQREQREQDLADCIICGSEFVKDSLVTRGVDANKIFVVSVGRSKQGQLSQTISDRKMPQERGDELRILFAGTVGLRKGIVYLLKALRQLKEEIRFSCKVVGSLEIKPQRVAEYSDVCDFMGRVPRSQMAELYAWADVLVLPSICEGSAMVTYEALTWGLPIITTYNSGSIIRDGVDGFIIPIRSAEAIAKELLRIYRGEYHYSSLPDTHQYLQGAYKYAEDILKQSMLGMHIH